MSATAARLPDLRQVVTGASVLVLGLAIGGLAGLDPKFAIAASFGLAFVVVAISNLAVGVTIFGVLAYMELAPVIGGPLVSFAKLAGLTLAISWIAYISSNPRDSRLIFSRHPALIGTALLYIAWALISMSWAEDSAEAFASAQRYALNIMLIPIVFTAIAQPKHVRWIAGAIVAGAAGAATYGLAVIPSAASASSSLTSAGDLNRITGTVGDPNLLASVLVVGMIMAIALTLDAARSAVARLACSGVAVLCFLAVVATVSRGGIVAMAAALIATILFAGRRRGRATVAAFTAAILITGYFAAFASDAQIERIEKSDGGAGRTDIWKVGWRMVEDKPGHGVGAGNFNVSSIHYLLVEPGAVDRSGFIVDQPAVAHNVYLEILAELGIVGLVMFLLIVILSIAASVKAARAFERAEADGLSLIARGIAVSLCSILAADFFLAAEYSKLLWLLISLGPAMLAVATAMEKGEETDDRATPASPRPA